MVVRLELVALLWLLPTLVFAAPANQLTNHPSPYLALHGSDPVAWQNWSDRVLKDALKENKLVFVSSGYFSCHWCHVMQRESFADDGIAEQLNQLAIPVKIDRELQPALDAWLVDFTERTAGHAGWPLNVFLTPDGYPLVGITYMPKESFASLLTDLQQRWRADEKLFRATALQAFQVMQSRPEPYSKTSLQPGMDKALSRRLQGQALSQADEIAGGFGDQSKFPMSPQLLALLDSQQRYPDPQLKQFLVLTLNQIAYLGLRDHLDGGFFRYTVDPAWDTPHFEKMLYDNALLAQVFLKGAGILDKPEYREIALETLRFVERVMKNRNGGYVASLSAVDGRDIEGGYYLWPLKTLEKLLSKDELDLIAHAWGVRGSPYLEGGHHIKQLWRVNDVTGVTGKSNDEIETALDSIRKKLIQVRERRVLPVDTKVLAAWNGLLLESFSIAARYDRRFTEVARDLYGVLARQFWNGRELYRFTHNGSPDGKVSLGDYAYVSMGMARWARVSGDRAVAEVALDIAKAGLQRFHTDVGWQLSESLVIPYNAREKILPDGALPSPSATLMRAFLLLNDGTPAVSQLGVYGDIENGALAAAPFWYASHITWINEFLMHND